MRRAIDGVALEVTSQRAAIGRERQLVLGQREVIHADGDDSRRRAAPRARPGTAPASPWAAAHPPSAAAAAPASPTGRRQKRRWRPAPAAARPPARRCAESCRRSGGAARRSGRG